MKRQIFNFFHYCVQIFCFYRYLQRNPLIAIYNNGNDLTHRVTDMYLQINEIHANIRLNSFSLSCKPNS